MEVQFFARCFPFAVLQDYAIESGGKITFTLSSRYLQFPSCMILRLKIPSLVSVEKRILTRLVDKANYNTDFLDTFVGRPV